MRQIDAATLHRRLQDGEALNLLDVREVIEYYTYNIGGLNIPVSKLTQQCENIGYNKQDEIIVICSAGIRSEAAVETLTQSGYQYVVNLKGGLKSLQKLNSKTST